MYSGLLLLSCCLTATINVVAAQDTEPYFRSDYKYEPTMSAFYKAHQSPKYWTEAFSTCKYEGASLVVPESQGENEILVKLIKNQLSRDTMGVFLGIHDMFVEGTFMTEEAYVPDATGNKCYKLHLEPKIWSEAYTICHAEQSYLAILTNKKESDQLKEMLAKHPENTLNGDYYKGGALLGFHDQFIEGQFITIFGKPLSETGFEEWDQGQPSNTNQIENCGSIFRNGLLNDISCSSKVLFFCERQVGNSDALGLFARVRNDISVVRSL